MNILLIENNNNQGTTEKPTTNKQIVNAVSKRVVHLEMSIETRHA